MGIDTEGYLKIPAHGSEPRLGSPVAKELRMTISRRNLLKGVGATGATLIGGSLLAACGGTSAPAGGATAAAGGATAAAGGRLEMFSWWTSGGEVDALKALYGVYRKQNPGVEIVNSAIAGGGSGGNMKAVLQSRMLGNKPPDSFQTHPGAEFANAWVKVGAMEPLDQLYTNEGYAKVLPASYIDLLSWQGKPYSVPVNVHRSNLTLFNKTLMNKIGGTAPTTWDEFFALAEKAKAHGIPAIGMAESSGNSTQYLLEKLLLAKLGPDAYKGLFEGKTAWDSQGVTAALEATARCFGYANPDFLSVAGSDLPSLVSSGKALLIINGDWCIGQFKAKNFTDFGWAPAPDTDGMFLLNSDSFGLPKGAPDPTQALNWLKTVGSKEGQDGFNPLKGSISPRSDRDVSKYDPYQRYAVEQWEGAKTLLPSVVDGGAASTQFVTAYGDAMQNFDVHKDPARAQADLVQAARDANFGN